MRHPTLVVSLVAAAALLVCVSVAIFASGGVVGGASPQPYSAEATTEILAALEESRHTQEAILAALEGLRRELELRVDTRGHGGVASTPQDSQGQDAEPGIRRPIAERDGYGTILDEIRRLLDSQGPIGSAEEGRRLQALPRTPPNYEVIEQLLRGGPKARYELLFASVDQVVSRLGFPGSVGIDGQYLIWRYAARERLPDKPHHLYLVLRISRNRVVSVSAN